MTAQDQSIVPVADPYTYLSLTGVRELDAIVISYLSTPRLMEVVRHFDSTDVEGSVPDAVWYSRLGQLVVTHCQSWWYVKNVPPITRQTHDISYWDVWLACAPRPYDTGDKAVRRDILTRLGVIYTRMSGAVRGHSSPPDPGADYPLVRFILDAMAACMHVRLDVVAWLALHVGLAAGYVSMVRAALDTLRTMREHIAKGYYTYIPPNYDLPASNMLSGHCPKDAWKPYEVVPYHRIGCIGEDAFTSIMSTTIGFPIPYEGAVEDRRARGSEGYVGYALGTVHLPTSAAMDQCYADCIELIADHVAWSRSEFGANPAPRPWSLSDQWQHNLVITSSLIGQATLRACYKHFNLESGLSYTRVGALLTSPLRRRDDYDAILELIKLVATTYGSQVIARETLHMEVLGSYSVVATDATSSRAYMSFASQVEGIGGAIAAASNLPLRDLFDINPPQLVSTQVAKILVVCHGIMLEDPRFALSLPEWVDYIKVGCNYTTWKNDISDRESTGPGPRWSRLDLYNRPTSWLPIIAALLWTDHEVGISLLASLVEMITDDRQKRNMVAKFSPRLIRGTYEAALASNVRDDRAARLMYKVEPVGVEWCIPLLLAIALRYESAGLDVLSPSSPARYLYDSLQATLEGDGGCEDPLSHTHDDVISTYDDPALCLVGLNRAVQSLLLTSNHLPLFSLLEAFHRIRRPCDRGNHQYIVHLNTPIVDVARLDRETARVLVDMLVASGELGYYEAGQSELVRYKDLHRAFETYRE